MLYRADGGGKFTSRRLKRWPDRACDNQKVNSTSRQAVTAVKSAANIRTGLTGHRRKS